MTTALTFPNKTHATSPPGAAGGAAEPVAAHGIMSPGIRLFRMIGFSAKAAWVSAAFILPILVLCGSLWSTSHDQIGFSAKERVGVEYVRPVIALIDAAQVRRRAASAKASDLAATSEKVAAALRAVELQDAILGAQLKTSEPLKHVQELQRKLASDPIAGDTGSTFGAHTAFIDAAFELLADVADNSNLTLDPDLDSFYLMDAAVSKQPQLLEAMGQLRGLGNAVLREGSMTQAARDRLAVQFARAGVLSTDLSRALSRTTEANAALKQEVNTAEAQQASAAFLSMAKENLFGEKLQGDPAAMLALANRAIELHYAANARMLTALDGLLAKRIAHMQTAFWTQMSIAIAGIVLASYLLVAFYRVTQGGVAEVARHLNEMAKGNLSTKPRPWGRDEAAQLMTTLAGTLDALRRIVAQVRRGAGEIEVASAEIATASMDLSSRTEETAARLQRTSAAMVQISDTVRRTSETATGTADIVTGNAEVAAQGGRIVDNVVKTMDGIHDSSSRIADIIGVIDGIAFQTNILALNAAVEAARAGEQGRGFAVVAAEVRALAQRTTAAAREVKTLIQTSVEQVDTGSKVVGEAGKTMRDIVGNAEKIKALIADISRSAAEQTHELSEVGSSVEHLDGMTQQNAALVEQTAAAAATLKDNAAKLTNEMAFFRIA